ncbi:MAG: carbamoyltransferase C-terminal domain-containing protein [Candidatus Thiodiazotropha sp.]
MAVVGARVQEETLGSNLEGFYERLGKRPPLGLGAVSHAISAIDNIFGFTIRRRIARRLVVSALESLGLASEKIRFINHHLAHAAGAYFLSGFPVALVITSDGKGDLCSNHSYVVEDGKFHLLASSAAHDSLGFFYAAATAFLGFKPLRHEGKVMGLSASGSSENTQHHAAPVSFDAESHSITNHLILKSEVDRRFVWMRKMLLEDPFVLIRWVTTKAGLLTQYAQYRLLRFFEDSFQACSREDIAAYAQSTLEEVGLSLVKSFIKEGETRDICLSGGTFANVVLNQKIASLPCVGKCFVQPAMDDSGLAAGAALTVANEGSESWQPAPIRSAFLGPEYSDQDIVESIESFGLDFQRIDDVPALAAQWLANGVIVGIFAGRLEWGPRALGNRSILVSAADPDINRRLNDRLRRSEFMPFAPCLPESLAEDVLVGYLRDDMCAKYMTRTYYVDQGFVEKIPAAVHLDGTARPYVVFEEQNPLLHEVLLQYGERTGVPVLINTSFNVHEEPIVCSPDDAIRAFLQGAVDVVFVGQFLVVGNGIECSSTI